MGDNPSVDVFISHVRDSVQRLQSKQRAWAELIDPNAFSRPSSLSEAASRVHHNAAYFRINYAQLLAAVLVLSLVSHPASLLCLALLCFAWLTLYLLRPPERTFSLWGRYSFSRNEVRGLLAVATALVLLFTSIGTLLVHAFLVGVALVSLHAAFTCPDAHQVPNRYAAAATYSSTNEAAFSLTKRSPARLVGDDDALASLV